MRFYPSPLDALVKRMHPDQSSHPADRASAWNEWVLAGGPAPVLAFIRHKNYTAADDEEILQETLIIAFVKMERGQYEDRDLPFTAFLKKIAWYKIMEASRQGAHQVSLDVIEEVVPSDTDEHEAPDLWQEHRTMRAAMGKLPPRRSCVMLMYKNGYHTGEIARMLQISEDLVRKEKSLGLRQLRETFVLACAS